MAVFQVFEDAASKKTSTYKIERALNALLEDQRKRNPTIH
jgi:hypothetical protein